MTSRMHAIKSDNIINATNTQASSANLQKSLLVKEPPNIRDDVSPSDEVTANVVVNY